MGLICLKLSKIYIEKDFRGTSIAADALDRVKQYAAQNGKDYVYEVFAKKIIEATDIESVAEYKDQEVLVLQSCWPPGTSLKRIIIVAKPKVFPEEEIKSV